MEWTKEQDELIMEYYDYGLNFLSEQLSIEKYLICERLKFFNLKVFIQGRKITKRKLKEVLPECYAISEVCKKFNMLTKGNSYDLIKGRILEYELCTKHFIKEIISNKKIDLPKENILSDGHIYRLSHIRLKNQMLSNGFIYQCSKCKISKWNEEEITLDIDHIDGNWGNCKKENLRFLCPNCHRQTGTFGGKGIKNKRTKEISKQIKNSKSILRRRNIDYRKLTDEETIKLANEYKATNKRRRNKII